MEPYGTNGTDLGEALSSRKRRSPRVLKMNRDMAAHHNRRTVLGLIAGRGPLSQLDISRLTHLQRSTVSYILRDLKKWGFVSDADRVVSGRVGPRETLVEMAPRSAWAAGLNLARTGHKLVLVNASGHTICQHAFPAETPLPELLDDLPARLTALSGRFRLTPEACAGLTVCLPGIIDVKEGIVLNSRSLDLQNFPLREEFAKRVSCELLIERNAVCGAYSELQLGGWEEGENIVYLVVRTERGRGSGEEQFSYGLAVTQEGRIPRGANSSFGELHGQALPTASLAKFRASARSREAFMREVGTVVGSLINLFDPRLFIICGSPEFTHLAEMKVLRAAAAEVITPFQGRKIDIESSSLGTDGVVLGAALLALHRGLEARLKALQEAPRAATVANT